jgi:hypothetical protein
MNPLSAIVTQCVAVQKALARLRLCTIDEYVRSVITASIQTLDVYVLEFRPWLQAEQKRGVDLPLFKPWSFAHFETCIDICDLRMDMLEEAFKDALETPLPNFLQRQLQQCAGEFADIRCTLASLILVSPYLQPHYVHDALNDRTFINFRQGGYVQA